jgi:HEAT repeat protein
MACLLALPIIGGCASADEDTGAVYQGKTATEWTQALVDKDHEVARAAADALIALGDDAVPVLLKSLKSTDPDMRAVSAIVLGRAASGDAEIAEEIIKLLGDKERTSEDDRPVASAAYRGLKMMEDAAAIPGLLDALKHKEPLVRELAAGLLGNIDTQPDVIAPALIELLRDDTVLEFGYEDVTPETHVWEIAMYSLEQKWDDAIPHLIRALEHQDPKVRARSAMTIGEIGWPSGEEADSALVVAMNDPNEDVREAAKEALATLEKEKKARQK